VSLKLIFPDVEIGASLTTAVAKYGEPTLVMLLETDRWSQA